MNQKFLISMLAGLVLILGGTMSYFLTAQKSVAPVVQTPLLVSKTVPVTEKTSPVVQNTPAVSVGQDRMAEWKTYKNEEYGFEFKYPMEWNTVANSSIGTDYKIITKLVNPNRAGKVDTGEPVEQFIVRSQNIVCEGSSSISLGNKIGINNNWEQGYASIYYRDLCFNTNEWPIVIALSAFDDESKALMNQILSTFKFTK